jgi:hypothetical protein
MPFIIPRTPKVITKRRFSRWKTHAQSDDFVLQSRGKTFIKAGKRKSRIIYKKFRFYAIECARVVECLQSLEWYYIVYDLPKVVPSGLPLNSKKRRLW